MSLNDKMIKLITYYQTHKTSYHVRRCRHIPSCSSYGKECYQKFGFFKASFYTAKRIMSCNIFSKKVYDPVPLSKEEKLEKKKRLKSYDELKKLLVLHAKLYPMMDIFDYIRLIYESNYGSLGLKADIKNYKLSKETSFISIGNGFFRAYVSKNEELEKFALLEEKSINKEALDIAYYEKLELFLKLVQRRKIKIDKKSARDIVYTNLLDGIKPVEHSDNFKMYYNPHYFIIKEDLLKK